MTRTVAHLSPLFRSMDDSTNWQAIPVGTPLVAGYVPPSGFAWPAAAWARFAGSVEVRITPQVSTTGLGVQVLDVETGDALPGQAPGWAAKQRSLGQIPTIYCSASAWGAVQAAFNSAGVAQPEYWVAAYPGGGQVLPTLNGITAVAHQYADPVMSGGDYDLSVVADYWPGVDGGMMSDFDTAIQIKYPDGTVYGDVKYGDMLANLYGMMFLGSASVPWAGKSIVGRLDDVAAAVKAGTAQEAADHAADLTALSNEQAAILAQVLPAIKAAGTATVDVTALAAQLAPAVAALIPPGATPAQFIAALDAQLAKP